VIRRYKWSIAEPTLDWVGKEAVLNHHRPRVIYGEGCRLGAARMRREGTFFKQAPYEIKVL
jgi:hypothetical protein